MRIGGNVNDGTRGRHRLGDVVSAQVNCPAAALRHGNVTKCHILRNRPEAFLRASELQYIVRAILTIHSVDATSGDFTNDVASARHGGPFVTSY